MQLEVLCGHPAKKFNFYTCSDQIYGNLKIASFVAILTKFGQTQVLDGFQRFHWKYSKTKTKQHRDSNLVLKLPIMNFSLDVILKPTKNGYFCLFQILCVR